jgi:hypothetical protein
MHKGYKCLDRSTGRIYISRDVVFDEYVFPYATPGVTIDIPTLRQAITFPTSEPATHDHIRKNDLSYLSTNPPSSEFFPVHVSTEQINTCVPGQLDMHGGTPSQEHVASQEHLAHAQPAFQEHPVMASRGSPGFDASLGSPGSLSSGDRVPDGSAPSAISTGPVNQQSTFPFADTLAATSSTAESIASASASGHGMITRLRDNTRREKIYTDGTVQYDPHRRALFLCPIMMLFVNLLGMLLCQMSSQLSLKLALGFLCLAPWRQYCWQQVGV